MFARCFFEVPLKGKGVMGWAVTWDRAQGGPLFAQHTPGRSGRARNVCVCPCALATPCDCRREHSEWDKLFIMLEDAQMRESMLLQATDDLLRGELRGLRAELGRLAGSLERPCAPAAPAAARLAPALDALLQASRDAGRRLARLEGAGAQRPEEAGGALGAVLQELRRTREDLRAVQGWAARRWLPAGKDPGQEGTSLRLCSPSARGGKPSQATLQANTLRRTTPSSSPPLSPLISPRMALGLRHTIHGREVSFKKYFPVPGNPEDS